MDKNLRLRLIMEALDKVTSPLKSIESQSGATGRALKATRDRLKVLQTAQKDIAAYRGHEQSVVSLQMKLAEQRRTVDQLRIAYTSADRPTKTLTRNYTNAREALSRLEREQNEHRQGLRDTEARLKAAGVATSNLATHEKRLMQEMSKANNEIDDQKRKLTELASRQRRVDQARASASKTQAFAGAAASGGGTAMAGGIALGAPLYKGGEAAVEFEDAMLDVRKVVDFDTPQQFSHMKSDVLDLAIELNQLPEGMSAIIAAAGQAKIARGELIGFAEDAGKMGIAFDTTAEDAGEKMATWRTAFGMTQPQVRALADQINYLGDNGNATALKISDVVTRIGPLGGVAGLAAAEVAALGSTIVGMGVEQEIAATGIKNTMLALTKGEAATKSQQKAYAALGLEATAVSKAMQLDAGGTILDVMTRISKLSKDRQASVMTQLFGSESVAAIAPMMSQLDVLKDNLNAVGDATLYTNSMQKEFENRQSGAKTSLGQARKAIGATAIEIADNFLPQIKAAGDSVVATAKAVRDFAKAHPVATKVVVVLVGVLATLLTVFGGIALAVAAVLGPFALLQFAWAGALPLLAPLGAGIAAAASATWAFTAALLANPITWIVVAVIALAAAAWLIYKNWGKIVAWWTPIWRNIRNAVDGAMQAAKNAILNFSPLGLFIRAFGGLWPMLSSLPERFRQIGAQLILGLIRGVIGKLADLRSTITNAASSAAQWFREKLGIHSPSRVFASYGGHVMEGLALGLDRARNMPLDAIGAAGAAMAGALVTGITPAAASPGAAPAAVSSGGDTYQINIYGAVGQDVNAMADAVIKRIQQIQGARARSSFRDDAE